MYNLINKNITVLLDFLKQHGSNHIEGYQKLIRTRPPLTNTYRSKYAQFWAMNSARLPQNYKDSYFNLLENALKNKCVPDINNIEWQIAKYNTLCFSFATKLIHTVDQTKPIYDQNVASFYFFLRPNDKAVNDRFVSLTSFYTFLTEEYKRILEGNLLAPSFQAFREMFTDAAEPTHYSDVKIIDTLIWTCVKWINRGNWNQKLYA